jgi:uncharacterized protein with HEPN domain
MKDDRLYLIHIIECIARIESYTQCPKQDFLRDTMRQDAVLRNLQTMAESTQRISAALKNAHSEVAWQRIGGFRNVLVHNYLGVNVARVWEVIEHGLPDLKRQIQAILQGLGEQPGGEVGG